MLHGVYSLSSITYNVYYVYCVFVSCIMYCFLYTVYTRENIHYGVFESVDHAQILVRVFFETILRSK